jgi:L-rhamnose isomerase/sugar isomerase
MNVQQATAKALLIDRDALAAAQADGDVLGAHGVLMDAYDTDVRGILADRRETLGLPRDPLRAFAESGYAAKVATERIGGTQASWGA